MTLEPNDPRHGTANGYRHHKCRCPACRDGQRLAMARSLARGGRTAAQSQVQSKARDRAAAYVRASHPDVWAACVAKAKAELGFDDVPDRRRSRP